MSSELPDFAALKLCLDGETFPNGARAELRRVARVDEVAFCPALYRLFPGQKPDDRHLRVVFLLPFSKHDAKGKTLGAQLAIAKVAEDRVMQVARARAPLDLIQLRRLLIYVEPVLDWQKFGQMLWYWNEQSKRELVECFYLALFTPVKGTQK